MISFKAVQSPQAAASYLQEAFAESRGSAEYYANDRAPSEWGGQSIQFAGLQPGVAVEKEDLVSILSGRLKLPDGQEQQLGRVTQEGVHHRSGWDFTFSAPKSVSMQALPGGDERVIAAHDAAVDRAMKFAEQHYAFARVTENRQTVSKQTGNLLYSKFQHETSRELDPQLHSHVVVANATFDRDSGRWYSLSNEGLVANRKVLDAIYKNELAQHLKALGYGVQWTKDGPELAGIDRAQIERFSTRRQQITEAIKEKFGKDIDQATHGQRQAATLATRSNKVHMDRPTLIERWQETARDIGLDLAALRERADHAPAREMNTDSQMVATVDKALRHLSEREMAFRETAFIRETLRFGRGDISMDAFERHVSGMMERGVVLPAEHHEVEQAEQHQASWPGPKIKTDRFLTTARAVARETAIVRDLLRNQNSVAPIADLEAVKRNLDQAEGVKLNAGQREAAELVLTTTHRYVGIQGYAGTGKTTLLQQVKQVAEDSGVKIIGMAAGAKQADVLGRETGIRSSTIARFLNAQRSGEHELETRAQLWVVDEASQASAHDMAEIMRHAEKTGAHVAFLGDMKQHQSVEAGPAFEQMIRGGMETARMTEIHRQKDAIGQEVVGQIAKEDVTEKDVVAAMNRLHAADRVVEMASDGDVKQRLASDWVKLTRDGATPERIAVVTATNKDRTEVNEAIRDARKTAGQVGEGRSFETYQPLDMTKQEIKSVFAYREKSLEIKKQTGKEPVIVMRAEADYPTKGIRRGDYLRIDALATETNTMMVQNLSASSGKRQAINPAQNSKFSVYQVEQREFASGDRVMFRRNEQDLGLVNGVSGTVQGIQNDGLIQVLTDHGKELAVDLGQYKHIDHAYAMTTYKVQGETVEKTLYHMSASSGVIGQRAFYVGVTRARSGTTIYTDDFEAATVKAAAAVDKTAALEHSKRDETARARAEKSDKRKATGSQEQKVEQVVTPEPQGTSQEIIPQEGNDLVRQYFGNSRLGEARSLARTIESNDSRHAARPGPGRGDGKVAEATIKAAAAHLSSIEQAFRESHLMETAARFSGGKVSSSQLHDAIHAMARSGGLVAVKHLESQGVADRFLTTPANQRIEREVIETMKGGNGQGLPSVHDYVALRGAIDGVDHRRGYRMTDSERGAVFHALSRRDRYTGIDYRDGDSRNSCIASIVAIGRYYDSRVLGIASNAATAHQLSRDAGVQTQSIQQFLIAQREIPGQIRQAIARMRENVDANLAYRNQHTQAATRDWSEPGLVGKLLGQATLVKDGNGIWREAELSDHLMKVAEIVAERLMNRAEAAWEKWRIGRAEAAVQHASNPRQLHTAYSRVLTMQARHLERAAKNMTRFTNGRVATLMRAFGYAATLRHVAFAREMARFLKVGGHQEKAARMREYAGHLREQAGRLSDIGRGRQETWVVADAHKLGVRETRELMDHAAKNGARIVFAGNTRDSQSVGAGRVFDQLTRAGMPTVQLGNLKPSHETNLMNGVVEKLEKNPAEAFKALDQQGRVRETNTLARTIARDYVAEGRKALLLAPSQAHRQEINNAVRDALKVQGKLKDGRGIQTLQPAGLSAVEKANVGAYKGRLDRGDHLVLRAERDYAAHDILRGDVVSIGKVESNTLHGTNTRTGAEVVLQVQHTADMTLYKAETREFAVGDTVVFRRGDGKQGIQNNQLGTVEKLDAKAVQVFTDDGRRIAVDLDRYRHLDHGYALTHEMAQGRAAKEVWQSIPKTQVGQVHHDRETGLRVVTGNSRGTRQFYSAVVSAKSDMRIYTDDKYCGPRISDSRLSFART